jgi:hypothetical protein
MYNKAPGNNYDPLVVINNRMQDRKKFLNLPKDFDC